MNLTGAQAAHGAAAQSPNSLAPIAMEEASQIGWTRRWFDLLSAYLPLLLMALLALGTWWLVKNTPVSEPGRAPVAVRHEPDYTMTRFMVQRFTANGLLHVQLEGDVMRHYADTDTLEIDNPRIQIFGVDRRVTLATARMALSNRDGSEVQLSGGAHVVRESGPGEDPIEFRGEFLHYFEYTERVQSHLPVLVTRGASQVRADGMTYDNLSRILDFKGHVRAVLASPR